MSYCIQRRVLNFLIVLGVITNANAQRATSKSNEISLDFKSPRQEGSGALPSITWITPQLEFSYSKSNKIEMQATVEYSQVLAGIRLLILSSKDQSVLASKSFAVETGRSTQVVKTQITLPEGATVLSLEATTENGFVVSERRQVVTGKGAEDMMVALDRKDYILLFATNKYDYWDDLVNPIDDAHDLADQLKVKYGFEVELVENPTTEEIWEKLREYNERRFGPQDQLMIFFAGHGQYDETFGEGYVVARNSLLNDPSKNSYLSHNRLRGVVNNIPCRHILLTMDVCFGGTLDPVIAGNRGAQENEVSVNQMLVRKWSHQTRKYLTSGGKEYVSDGISGKHSPFAGKLLETLHGSVGDDRILTLAELLSSLEKLKQLPRFGSFGNDEPMSDFVFVGK